MNVSLAVNSLCEVIPNMHATYWTHIAVTLSSDVTLYSNGSIMATKSIGSPGFLPKQLILGAGSSNQKYNNFFTGRMDEVRIWQVPVQVSTTMCSRTAEDVSKLVVVFIVVPISFRMLFWLLIGTSIMALERPRPMSRSKAYEHCGTRTRQQTLQWQL